MHVVLNFRQCSSKYIFRLSVQVASLVTVIVLHIMADYSVSWKHRLVDRYIENIMKWPYNLVI